MHRFKSIKEPKYDKYKTTLRIVIIKLFQKPGMKMKSLYSEEQRENCIRYLTETMKVSRQKKMKQCI